jgi:hypothetical protein
VATATPRTLPTKTPASNTFTTISVLAVNAAMTPIAVLLYGDDLMPQITGKDGKAKLKAAKVGKNYTIIPSRYGYVFEPASQSIIAGTGQLIFVGEAQEVPDNCEQIDVTKQLMAIAKAADALRNYGISLASPNNAESAKSKKINSQFSKLMTINRMLPEIILNCVGPKICAKKPLDPLLIQYEKGVNTLHRHVARLAMQIQKTKSKLKNANYSAEAGALKRKVLKALHDFPIETDDCI